jgi:hypothetical protein
MPTLTADALVHHLRQLTDAGGADNRLVVASRDYYMVFAGRRGEPELLAEAVGNFYLPRAAELTPAPRQPCSRNTASRATRPQQPLPRRAPALRRRLHHASPPRSSRSSPSAYGVDDRRARGVRPPARRPRADPQPRPPPPDAPAQRAPRLGHPQDGLPGAAGDQHAPGDRPRQRRRAARGRQARHLPGLGRVLRHRRAAPVATQRRPFPRHPRSPTSSRGPSTSASARCSSTRRATSAASSTSTSSRACTAPSSAAHPASDAHPPSRRAS